MMIEPEPTEVMPDDEPRDRAEDDRRDRPEPNLRTRRASRALAERQAVLPHLEQRAGDEAGRGR